MYLESRTKQLGAINQATSKFDLPQSKLTRCLRGFFSWGACEDDPREEFLDIMDLISRSSIDVTRYSFFHYYAPPYPFSPWKWKITLNERKLILEIHAFSTEPSLWEDVYRIVLSWMIIRGVGH